MKLLVYCLEIGGEFSPGDYPQFPKPAVGELILNCTDQQGRRHTLEVSRVSHDYDRGEIIVATHVYRPLS